jgi:perosamine synthetase
MTRPLGMRADSQRFLPYGRQTIEDDDVDAVVKALRGDYLTTGPLVGEFERALSAHVGANHAVAVANGTAALHAAYAAAGVGPESEVVVPAVTFLATANAARFLGARVVFADVDPDTGLLTVETLRDRVGSRTRVIAPVHLTGTPCDMAGIARVAADIGASVIEDAAHAIGASDGSAPVGACRHSAACVFSFHPVKQMTTAEGGAIVTNDEALARGMREFRSHGMVHDTARFEDEPVAPGYYEQHSLGYNYRITDVQCALGLTQLKKLPAFIERRRALARLYDDALRELSLVLPVTRGALAQVSGYHLYAVLIDFAALGTTRMAVMQGLRALGVGTQMHYPPVPSQPYYRKLGERPERYPGAQSYAARTLSLPLYPSMRDEDVLCVVEALKSVLGRGP